VSKPTRKLVLECAILIQKYMRELANAPPSTTTTNRPVAAAQKGARENKQLVNKLIVLTAVFRPSFLRVDVLAAEEIEALLQREQLPLPLLLRVLFRLPTMFQSACLTRAVTSMARRDQMRLLQVALNESAFVRDKIEGRIVSLQRMLERLELRMPLFGKDKNTIVQMASSAACSRARR